MLFRSLCNAGPGDAWALRGQIVELSVELRDGHDTAPSTPVQFRGALLEAPR